ncbi:MAG: S8 family serine peptidase [Flavobacteriales bacterium]|nr:S8 family serine peptidase [Flavobacteriales bacterium]
MNLFTKYLLLASIFFIFSGFTEDDSWQVKVDKELLNTPTSTNKIEFIVLLKEQADVSGAKLLKTKEEKGEYVFTKLKATATQTQKGLINLLEKKDVIYKSFYLVNSLWVWGTIEDLEDLARLPEVEKITVNPHIQFEGPVSKGDNTTTAKKKALEWGITTTKADQVWALGYKGQGVVIGGQDTGYEWDHPALKGKYRGWNGSTANHNYNWHDAITTGNGGSCGLNSPFPCDDDRHGTHTMGTMVGDDGGANQIGMAPDAKWIGCRNMDEGNGTPATYIECFEWFLAPTDLNNLNPDPTKAPHVINNSWGCPLSEGCNPSNFSTMEIAVNNLKLAGVVVVVSAGNSGPDCGSIDDPSAIFESSFSVGATNVSDNIAGFSSRGLVTVDGSNRLKPDISAPGVDVRSCIPGGGYDSFSGTSMAGPHVVGMVALIISAYPTLAGNVDSIETIIKNSALHLTSNQDCGTVLGSSIPNAVYGYGRIDVLAAINSVALNVNDNNTTNQVLIYPNPSNGNFNLIMNGFKDDNTTVEIFDALGKTVVSRNLVITTNNFKQNFDYKLAKGVYFIKITNGKEVKTIHFVVQ